MLNEIIHLRTFHKAKQVGVRAMVVVQLLLLVRPLQLFKAGTNSGQNAAALDQAPSRHVSEKLQITVNGSKPNLFEIRIFSEKHALWRVPNRVVEKLGGSSGEKSEQRNRQKKFRDTNFSSL